MYLIKKILKDILSLKINKQQNVFKFTSRSVKYYRFLKIQTSQTICGFMSTSLSNQCQLAVQGSVCLVLRYKLSKKQVNNQVLLEQKLLISLDEKRSKSLRSCETLLNL